MTWHFLYLTSHCLSAYAWKSGRLRPEARFEAGPEGLARFAAYLDSHRKSAFRILANLRDESFQADRIPWLPARDRQAVIARKLEQHYPGIPLTSAFSLGYEMDRRRNEKLLLSALTNPSEFKPWLEALAAAQSRLAGFHTLAQLSGDLLRKLPALPGRCLLLTRQDDTVRASLVSGGRTLFSRLAPLAGDSFLAVCTGEARKLQQYAASQHLSERHEDLPVVVLAHPSTIAAAESGSPPWIFLDSHEAAARLKLDVRPADDCSEVLFLHFLAARPPRQQFAGRELLRDYRLARLKRTLAATVAATFLTALPLAGKGYWDSRAYLAETRQLQEREKALQQEHGDLSGTLPRLAIDHDTLRQVTTRFTHLMHACRHPGAAFGLISHALERSPEIEIESLAWQTGAGTGEECREDLVLQGFVNAAADAGPDQALAAFDRFVQNLEQLPGTRAVVRSSPTGSGRIPAQGEGKASYAFTVDVTRKPLP